jgi:carboxyl-terminal processing protease
MEFLPPAGKYWRIASNSGISHFIMNDQVLNPSKGDTFPHPVMRFFAMRFFILLLLARFALPLCANAADQAPDSAAVRTNKVQHWEPGPSDGLIAFTVADMLEKFHYLHLKFDTNVSSRFLDLYINTFDPQHIHFLQSDLDEFEKYRYTLGDLTLTQRDTTPAYVIFTRFMERLAQRTEFSKELLQTENFTFNHDDHVSLNRKTAPFPKDLDEAKQLWRDHLRAEYLDEKLNEESPKALSTFWSTRDNPVAAGFADRDFHAQIVKFVDTRYNRVLRNFRELENDKVLEIYLTALARVYDPHSDYEDKATLENFSIQMSLSLFGIGALLQTDDDGYCKIVSLTPGAPAAGTKKIKPGDRIVAVAQGDAEPVDVVEMPLIKVVEMIRGPKGSTVRLTLIPADADSSTHTVVSVVRDEIKLEDQQAKAKIIEQPGENGATQRLGVVDLPSFYASFSVMGSRNRADFKSASRDVNRLLDKLEEEHVDGVILDLRHNGGGSLPEAIELAGLFIKQGPVVQVASADGSVQVYNDPDPRVQYDGPLVVLTDKFSASASEIVAGALQDYGRAVLVGDESTHGKGTVQSMSQLAPYLYMQGQFFGNVSPASLGALKYTTNKFYRVSGSSTQLKGVVPNIILPSTLDYLETEEASEENAMKWDTIKSADYEKLNRVEPYITELQKRSAARVADSKDFAYIREDIETTKKIMADKIVSLNEHQRLKEAAEAEDRKKTRDEDFKTRKPSQKKIYDLTLKPNGVEMVEEKKDGNLDIPATAEIAPVSAEPAKPAPPVIPTPEERAPLDEAEQILSDYISLLHSGHSLTAQQSSTATTQP